MAWRFRFAFCCVTTFASRLRRTARGSDRLAPLPARYRRRFCNYFCYDSLFVTRERESEAMIYLSQVLGRPILDLEGRRVATLKDVILRVRARDHPPAAG